MPQPSGQVLLDSAKPNYAAASFWYCDGASLWDAKAGATLTKTGTAGTAAEGGANVVLGNGSTYYALASALSLTGAFTLFFKARTTTNGSTASMVTGNRSGTANYVWLAADGANMQVRASSTTQSYTSSNSATMAHFAVVRSASNVLSVYKNGALTQSKTLAGTLSLTHILSGHSSASLNLNGALEFMHVIAGVELDATAVASYYADPYQDLLAASGVDATAGGALLSAVASLVSGTAAGEAAGSAPGTMLTVGASFVAGAAAGGVGNAITLTSPTPYQSRQRDLVANTATFTVSGTYTGSPASIQYRFAGGAWATLVASPSGGVFTTTVTLATGQGMFEVRFSNDTAVTASAGYVTVGDGYIVGGQSNHAGRASAVVAPVSTNFVVTKLRRNGAWKQLTEATTGAETFDEGTGAQASYFGALSNRLQSVGVPVFFMPCAEGSASINDWARYDPDPTNPYFLYGDMRVADQRAGGHRAVLWLQGETDAANGMAQATYQGKLDDLVSDWNTDTGRPVFLIQIVRWSSSIYGQIDAIRAAQAAVAASNPNVAGIVDGNVWQSANDVHYTTATHINALADVVSAGMVTAFYTTSATAAGATITATASMQAGAAVGMGSATAPGITLEAVAQLLAGIATGGSAFTAAGATLTATASLLPGAATGQLSATASGALWSAVASLVAGGASNGSIVWPATRAGEAATARVPFDGVRVIVPDADDPAAPVKAIPLYLADTERILVDWEAKYLPGAGDTAATVLALDAPVGVSVTPSVAPGAALTTGVVVLAVTPTGAAGTYRVALRIGTAGGRESTALVDVVVSATVQSAKTFRLRSTADRDVYDLDFAAKYLAGAADVADVLLSTSADAGLAADARLDVGGVVQVAVDNPDAPGTYQVRTQLQTAAGRRKTGAIDVEVLA